MIDITINGDVNINLSNCEVNMNIIGFHGQNKAGGLQEFEFETNAAAGDTFDPSTVYGGGDTPTWIFEDGSELTGASISTLGSAVGLDGTVQTVKLRVADLTQITNFNASGDKIVNTFDATPLSGCLEIFLQTNAGLTGFTVTENVRSITALYLNGCNITGTLSLVNLRFDTGFTELYAHTNANMTSITFNNTDSQTLRQFQVQTCNLTGAINTTNIQCSSFLLSTNALLTEVIGIEFFTSSANSFTAINTDIEDNNGNFLNTATTNAVIDLDIRFCGLTSAEVNGWLVYMDNNTTVSNSGTIDLGGTNDSADETSGGFDGITAKDNLDTKGFTVNINE